MGYFSSDFKLGILGGGQLGKMLLQETRKFDIQTMVLDVIRLFMFSRPFGDKEFTVNIMYVDEEKGIRMMSAWKKSTFGK
jgi:phosphoribosylaminoimidazole carboxylase (NCAIR synthetase)